MCLAGLEAGEVGLVLTYAVTLIGNFQWTVRQSAEVENMVRTCQSLSSSTTDCTPVLQRCFQLVVSQLVVVIESRSATVRAVGVAMHSGDILGLSWDIISSSWTMCVCLTRVSAWSAVLVCLVR